MSAVVVTICPQTSSSLKFTRVCLVVSLQFATFPYQVVETNHEDANTPFQVGSLTFHTRTWDLTKG
jgi:hypothetical protein